MTARNMQACPIGPCKFVIEYNKGECYHLKEHKEAKNCSEDLNTFDFPCKPCRPVKGKKGGKKK